MRAMIPKNIPSEVCGDGGFVGDPEWVLHLCAGPERATRLTELRERVRGLFTARGLQVPPCISLPPRVFSGILHLASRFMAAETRRAVGTLPVFLDYLGSEQRFENAATRRWLEEAGIAAPGWESYIDTVLGAYLDAKTAAQPAASRRAAVV
ncbi:MAG: hypothetical protein EA420_14330 [Candidatus Competibacteraceae bacterium]|nr:MAG: hypothetical protein EA420_14330 [Candidatus Competibacteraceae bacterium]